MMMIIKNLDELDFYRKRIKNKLNEIKNINEFKGDLLKVSELMLEGRRVFYGSRNLDNEFKEAIDKQLENDEDY